MREDARSVGGTADDSEMVVLDVRNFLLRSVLCWCICIASICIAKQTKFCQPRLTLSNEGNAIHCSLVLCRSTAHDSLAITSFMRSSHSEVQMSSPSLASFFLNAMHFDTKFPFSTSSAATSAMPSAARMSSVHLDVSRYTMGLHLSPSMPQLAVNPLSLAWCTLAPLLVKSSAVDT
mmetsp:Transcript_28157/g.52467  ORF Transcript_28157/g.52467 Transcript_28157/m.52467 type:complete len:177 (-) Transcript_28157:459-989(-)